jgi:hypothetical protein
LQNNSLCPRAVIPAQTGIHIERASCKTPKTPFDRLASSRLRVNGILIDPFVVSLSNNLSRSW